DPLLEGQTHTMALRPGLRRRRRGRSAPRLALLRVAAAEYDRRQDGHGEGGGQPLVGRSLLAACVRAYRPPLRRRVAAGVALRRSRALASCVEGRTTR